MIIRWLKGGFRHLFPLPVPGIAVPPALDPGHLIGAPEVVAVPIFAQPTLLAGRLAGLLTLRFGAELLTTADPWIWHEQLPATKALRSSWGTRHRRDRWRTNEKGRSSKKKTDRKKTEEEGRRALSRRARRKSSGRTSNFKPAVSDQFHFAADTRSISCSVPPNLPGLNRNNRRWLPRFC